jgi:hypothetical protein
MCVLFDPYLYYLYYSEPDVSKNVGCSFSFSFSFFSLFALSPAMFSQRRVFSFLSAFVSSLCGAYSLKTLSTAVGLYRVPVSVFTAKVLGHCIFSLLVLLPMI